MLELEIILLGIEGLLSNIIFEYRMDK